MGCFSGSVMSAASDQKLFCKLCSPFFCSFDEFVEEKVISPSYSFAILTPPPPVLIYLTIGSMFLSAAFIPIPPSLSPPSSDNHKTDLLFHDFVCFWTINDLRYYVSSCYTTYWFGVSIHFKMITMISLALSSYKNIA